MVDIKKEKKSLIFTGIDAQSLFSEKLKLYIKTMLLYCFKCIKKAEHQRNRIKKMLNIKFYSMPVYDE